MSKDSCPTWIFRHREDSRTLAWEALRDIHMTMSCGVFSWVDSCGTKTHVPHESLDIEKTHEHSHEEPCETFIWLCHVGQRRMRSFFAKETCETLHVSQVEMTVSTDSVGHESLWDRSPMYDYVYRLSGTWVSCMTKSCGTKTDMTL